jgi:putative hydrolase of the HAD superfamily
MITTVIFDLDDTLYDEIDYCRSGFAAVAEELAAQPKMPGQQQLCQAFWDTFYDGNHTTTFNAALEHLGIPYNQQLIEELVTTYRQHTPAIPLPAETKQVLHILARSYTLALLTDGFLPAQQLKVKALGIEKYFKSIVYSEQLGRQCWKPSPVGFERLLETLKVKPRDCGYVADDAQKDFIAPNRLGMVTIQVKRPRRLHTACPTQTIATPKHTITRLADLPDLLECL